MDTEIRSGDPKSSPGLIKRFCGVPPIECAKSAIVIEVFVCAVAVVTLLPVDNHCLTSLNPVEKSGVNSKVMVLDIPLVRAIPFVKLSGIDNDEELPINILLTPPPTSFA